jgi:plastocyanin
MLRYALGALLLGTGLPAAAATVEVTVEAMSFAPAQVSVRAGDTVRWTLAATPSGGGYGDPEPAGMAHNVSSDTGLFRSGEPEAGPWQFSHLFTQPGTYRYYCERHGAPAGTGMSGTVVVQAATLQINEGVAGAWFNPATSGQGFFFDVHPGSNLFGLAWFTWTDQPGVYDWLTGVGRFAGASTQVALSRTRGGRFNAPLAVTSGDAGAAVLTFADCTHARLEFALTEPVRSGSIELVKLLPVSPLCVPPAAAAAGR